MKRLVRCLLLLAMSVASQAFAGGIVHIANGDCAALSAAAGAQPGQEPSLIVLARNGSYAGCPMNVSGNVTIDGAGAWMPLIQNRSDSGLGNQITIASGARLTIRNLNFGYPASALPAAETKVAPKFLVSYAPAIANGGTLVLDSVSVSGERFGYSGVGMIGGGFIANQGTLVLRNTSIIDALNGFGTPLLNGKVDISHSTISNSQGGSTTLLGGTATSISVANSVLVNNDGQVCDSGTGFASRGGNITTDASCRFNSQNDRIVGDARLLDFGTHGGVVNTLALNYDSPAIGNGLLANCEATDARGLARGQSACDSGAYEVGGGDGKLSATGMSGLYFNSANNGHYVSIQRLAGDLALVIWNTFDEAGTPAWLYGVGTISGGQIHVEQVAQNVGGVLHAGGSVTGATPRLWGTFDLNLSDCYNASLTYNSLFPQFGSGSTALQRLVFLDGVNCAR
jgi:hypothetical protein